MSSGSVMMSSPSLKGGYELCWMSYFCDSMEVTCICISMDMSTHFGFFLLERFFYIKGLLEIYLG